MGDNGEICFSPIKDIDQGRVEIAVNSTLSLKSRQWQSGRAIMFHLRLLQEQSYEHSPTLWKEANDMFSLSKGIYGDVQSIRSCFLYSSSTDDLTNQKGCMMTAAQFWIEYGLCFHFFQFGDKVKRGK